MGRRENHAIEPGVSVEEAVSGAAEELFPPRCVTRLQGPGASSTFILLVSTHGDTLANLWIDTACFLSYFLTPRYHPGGIMEVS